MKLKFKSKCKNIKCGIVRCFSTSAPKWMNECQAPHSHSLDRQHTANIAQCHDFTASSNPPADKRTREQRVAGGTRPQSESKASNVVCFTVWRSDVK